MQELLEKERIAGSAFQATLGKCVARIDELSNQCHRVLLSEWPEVDGDKGAAVGGAAPALVELVSINTRSQHEQCGAFRYRLGEGRQVGQGDSVGPVSVFHDGEDGPGVALSSDQGGYDRLLAPVARGVVHGFVKCPQLRGLGEVQQVLEKNRLAGLEPAIVERRLRCSMSLILTASGRYAE